MHEDRWHCVDLCQLFEKSIKGILSRFVKTLNTHGACANNTRHIIDYVVNRLFRARTKTHLIQVTYIYLLARVYNAVYHIGVMRSVHLEITALRNLTCIVNCWRITIVINIWTVWQLKNRAKAKSIYSWNLLQFFF